MGKITLKLNDDLIIRVKKYAQNNKTTLSQIIETHLLDIMNNQVEITPIVKSLSGIIDSAKSQDIKTLFKNHLSSKYST